MTNKERFINNNNLIGVLTSVIEETTAVNKTYSPELSRVLTRMRELRDTVRQENMKLKQGETWD